MNGSMLERDGDDDVALCASVVATSDDVEVLSDREDSVLFVRLCLPTLNIWWIAPMCWKEVLVDIVAALLKPSELNER